MSAHPSWVGHRIEVEITAVAHGGHCVGRHEGRVLFVRHALPGEHVVALVTEDRGGSYCRADAVEVLRPSAERVEPPCPLAHPGGCGGCDWQHASGGEQRRLKAQVVADSLRRIAGVDYPVDVQPLPPAHDEGELLRWRSRVRLAVDDQGRAGFRAHRSHRVIPLDDCPITTVGAVPAITARHWPPGAEVDLAVDDEQQRHVTVQEPNRRGPHRSSTAVQRAVGRMWRLSARGFWQVHAHAADVLARTVRELGAAPRGGTAWDLYAGVGLFAAVLGEQVGSHGSVFAVESSARAVADARRNLSDLPWVSCHAGRVDRMLGAESSAAGSPDVVVLDPPRKGAGRKVVNAIASAGPTRVVHVACDPAALARDVADFAAHGFQLTELRAFDAFPMTHHVECVALLIAGQQR